jgi:hypothetical protein
MHSKPSSHDGLKKLQRRPVSGGPVPVPVSGGGPVPVPVPGGGPVPVPGGGPVPVPGAGAIPGRQPQPHPGTTNFSLFSSHAKVKARHSSEVESGETYSMRNPLGHDPGRTPPGRVR